MVIGGGGFGKTTLVSQWLRDDPRSVAWLSATRQHDDPAVILADIVRVLDEFEPLEPRAKQQLAAVALDFSSVLIPRLERTVAERGRPFVLVIDDAQRLRRRPVWSLIQALADRRAGRVAAGVDLADGTRARARSHARRPSGAHVGTAALAMDRSEAGRLFEMSGLALPGPVVDRLWTRTEGWPVGLYLATLALAEQDDIIDAAEHFAGDDRLVVDYVREELLSVLPRECVSSSSRLRCSTSSRPRCATPYSSATTRLGCWRKRHTRSSCSSHSTAGARPTECINCCARR